MEKLELPLNEAVIEAAKQNFDRDVLVGLEPRSSWKELQALYEEEARVILLETGENYLPEYGGPHIVLKR